MRELLQNHPGAAVAALILGFGFLILIHELGHFLVAKWAGIRATQFAIGFGPAIASWRKGLGFRAGSTEAEYERIARERAADNPTEDQLYAAADAAGLGETEYRLNWLPLGGYVKMLGQEDLDPAAASQDPRAYNRKPIWKRMAVISAGVVMNLLFGIIALVLAFGPSAGVSFPAPVVGGVNSGQPAATTYALGHEGEAAYLGLLPGDVITGLNGEPVEDMVAVRIATALGGRSNAVRLNIDRPGVEERLSYEFLPKVSRTSNQMLAVGLRPAATDVVAFVAEDSVWAAAGVAPGERLLSVAGEPVSPGEPLQHAFVRGGAGPVEVRFENAEGVVRTLSVRPRPALARDPSGIESLLGLEPLSRINDVQADSAASTIGLRPGDVIARAGAAEWPSGGELLAAIGRVQSLGTPLEVVVLRGGERVELPPAELGDGQVALGIGYTTATDSNRVATPGRDAALSLPGGSKVEAINGQPVSDFADLQRLVQQAARGGAGSVIEVRFLAPIGGGSEDIATVTLTAAQADALVHAHWAPPEGIGFRPMQVLIAGSTHVEAAGIGLRKTGEFIQQTYVTLLRLFQGDVKVTHLRGPVGIVDEGSKLARGGWPYYFYFLGIISINLAVINFLPFPIVDGGHMVFLAIEKLRGKPAGPQIQTAVTLVGLCLVAVFFVVVTYNDLFRLITGAAG